MTTTATTIVNIPEGELVTTAAPQEPEWFEARRGGITGTDIPKILGLTKYGNTMSVWLDKRGELADDTAGEAARWGNLLEDPVAQEWAHRKQSMVQPVGVIAHRRDDWIRASLDRVVVGDCPDGGGEGCGLEVKTRSAYVADRWDEGIPDDVLAQTTWGLRATGFDHMHVAALIGGQKLKSYRVDRDEELIKYLIEHAQPVWDAVNAGVPPEVAPDSEGVLLDLLNQMYANRAGDRDLDPVRAGAWLDQYRDAAADSKAAEARKEEAKAGLIQLLEDGDTGLVDEKPVFTYKRPKPSTGMPSGQVARLAIAEPDIYTHLVEAGFITTTQGAPRFALKKRG